MSTLSKWTERTGPTRYADLRRRQPKGPVALVSFLFTMWGFAYGLLDNMNKAVQNLMGIDKERSSVLAAAYYGAYIFGVLVISGPVKSRFGYRATFVTGLILLALGAFLMCPTTKAGSFAGMNIAQCILGLGVSTLENSANPYIANCGPIKWAEMRLNFAQFWAAAATVVAALIASMVIFAHGVDSTDPIVKLYEIMGGFTVGLAFLYIILAKYIPEINEDEGDAMAQLPASLWESLKDARRNMCDRKYIRLWLAAAGVFLCLGAQVTVAQWFINYCVEVTSITDRKAGQYLAIAQGLFAIGRLFASMMDYYLNPRIVLAAFTFGCIMSSLGAMFIPGRGGIAFAMLIMFFESTIFPTIFATGEKGLGRFSKIGSNLLVACISGGATLAPVQGKIAKAWGVQKSFIVPTVAFAVLGVYPLYINTSGKKDLDTWNQDIEVPSHVESAAITQPAEKV